MTRYAAIVNRPGFLPDFTDDITYAQPVEAWTVLATDQAELEDYSPIVATLEALSTGVYAPFVNGAMGALQTWQIESDGTGYVTLDGLAYSVFALDELSSEQIRSIEYDDFDQLVDVEYLVDTNGMETVTYDASMSDRLVGGARGVFADGFRCSEDRSVKVLIIPGTAWGDHHGSVAERANATDLLTEYADYVIGLTGMFSSEAIGVRVGEAIPASLAVRILDLARGDAEYNSDTVGEIELAIFDDALELWLVDELRRMVRKLAGDDVAERVTTDAVRRAVSECARDGIAQWCTEGADSGYLYGQDDVVAELIHTLTVERVE